MKEYAIFVTCEEDKGPNFGGRYPLHRRGSEYPGWSGRCSCQIEGRRRDHHRYSDW